MGERESGSTREKREREREMQMREGRERKRDSGGEIVGVRERDSW